jgi:hypothetical protein
VVGPSNATTTAAATSSVGSTSAAPYRRLARPVNTSGLTAARRQSPTPSAASGVSVNSSAPHSQPEPDARAARAAADSNVTAISSFAAHSSPRRRNHNIRRAPS